MQTCQIRPSVNGLTCFYENNMDQTDSIALFSADGELLESVPALRVRNNLDVTREAWFSYTLDRTENQHFFLPQVQQIFESSSDQYRWVIPMTRVVEITKGTDTVQWDFADPSELYRT